MSGPLVKGRARRAATACRLIAIAVGAVLLLGTPAAQGFELTPLPTNSERREARRMSKIEFRLSFPLVEFALHSFSTPVHEAITQAGFDCEGGIDTCTDLELDFAPRGVIAGVRWNDDPPFQFGDGQGRYAGCPNSRTSTISFALRTRCWYNHFKDVAAIAEANPEAYTGGSGTMLARSHFGDLQFLHAMAPRVGTPAQDTKAKIMMWAEFAWRVQSGGADFIAATTRTGAVAVAGFQDHFPKREERSVSDLFTVGRQWLRHQLDDIAFGSLLHMIEDSFAGGHVARGGPPAAGCAAAPIVAFHTYAGQDKAAHKLHDDLDHAQTKASLIEVLRELVGRRDTNQSWAEVRPYLDECVFRLADDAGDASTAVDD